MSDVRLTVGGRHYTVACADGEEDHLGRLAAMVDAKLTALGGGLGTPEAKHLLIAALILADEVHEAKRGSETGREGGGSDPALAQTLEILADRLEKSATTLERSAPAS